MSFSANVKEEIGHRESLARHCRIAELLALVLATGYAELKQGLVKLIVRPENDLIADKICRLTDLVFDREIKWNRNGKDMELCRQDMVERFLETIKLSDYVDLMEEDWLDEEELRDIEKKITYVATEGVFLQNCTFPHQVVQKDCCKKAFLRGFFLATGSVNNPKKAYHFEIVLKNRDMAEQVKDMICHFELDAKIAKRKKCYIVYLKEGAMIVDMLNVMEAHLSLMDMENVRILKDMRNRINRCVNCETANIKKTVDAAARQIEDIKYIEQTKGLKVLNSSLRQLARLRLEEPDANLKELGEMLNPPVSKSGVNHRLRKISSIANALREDNQI